MPTRFKIGALTFLLFLQACNIFSTHEEIGINPDTTCCYSFSAKLQTPSDIQVQEIKRYAFKDTLHFQGMIKADPNHQVSVSVPLKGFLKSVHVYPGNIVSRGELLAILEHPHYSELQLEFLETKGRYEYLKMDYARQGELGLEQATSLKNVQRAQAEYVSIESKLYALRTQLQYIGINPDSIHLYNIVSTIQIKAPIGGIVTYSDLSLGKLCVEEVPLFTIIDYSKLLISFSVPQKALTQSLKNEIIHFYLPFNPRKNYSAEISTSLPVIEKTGSFVFSAEFTNDDNMLCPGMEVQAILPYTDSVYAIPAKAVLQLVGGNYIYCEKSDGCFNLRKVSADREQETLIEITNAEPLLSTGRVLVTGLEKIKSCK